MTKSDSGTWLLSGANSYTGTSTINGGILGFASGALGTTGNIAVSSTGNGTLRWLSANTQDISGRLVMANGRIATFDTNGNNVTFANAIGSSSSSALVKTGLGTLTFQGDNSYSGSTTVTGGGTLVLDYTNNNGTKLSETPAALTLTGSSLVLKGGTQTETVSSTTLTANFSSSISRDGGTAKINLGAITSNAANATLAFSHPNMATTTNANAVSNSINTGILALGRVTVGSHFGSNDGTPANNIVEYGGYTNYIAGGTTGGVGNINTVAQLTGGQLDRLRASDHQRRQQ